MGRVYWSDFYGSRTQGRNLEQFIGSFRADKSVKRCDSDKFTSCSNMNGDGIRDNLYDKIVTTYRICMT